MPAVRRFPTGGKSDYKENFGLLFGQTMGNFDRDVADLLSRAVHDTLDVLVAPSVRHSLVREALRRGGLQEIPRTVPAVRAFIEGPLKAAASKAFGPELAASVAEEVVRVFDQAQIARARTKTTPPAQPARNASASGRTPRRVASPVPSPRRTLSPRPAPQSYVRRQAIAKSRSNPAVSPSEYFRRIAGKGSERGALEPAPLPLVGRRRVLAATTDPELLDALAGWLGNHAELRCVRNVFDLVRAIESSVKTTNIVVLDCAAPSIRPAALAALAEELEMTRVVVCRPFPETEQELAAVSPATSSWTRLYDRDQAADIAAWCLELVS